MELTSPSVIRSLMEEAGITFRKEFGQNFLINRDTVARIADAAAEQCGRGILPTVCEPVDFAKAIEMAKEYIRSGKYNADEIGRLVGYEDSNYFYRIFKKQTVFTISLCI